MPCTEVKSSKYQTRKSPAFHASDCKGLQKKGKDGTYLSQADKRGIYKWVKKGTQKRKGKYYDVVDNGSHPYRVYIDGSSVSIYKGDAYDILIKKISVKKVYLGKGKGSSLGNSILLHVSGKKYIYIGHEIYEFQMEDTVDSYFSLIGNSDVPYPVLLGTEYAYFMLDNCYVPRTSFSPSMKKSDWEDAYQRFYGWTNPMTGEKQSADVMKGKKMKGFHMIAKRGA
jgi:hypothetical protein